MALGVTSDVISVACERNTVCVCVCVCVRACVCDVKIVWKVLARAKIFRRDLHTKGGGGGHLQKVGTEREKE